MFENDPATVVDSDVALSDADSTDFEGGFLRIAYTSGGVSEDQLDIDDLVVDGVSIGTVDPIEDGVDGAALHDRAGDPAQRLMVPRG